MDIQFSLEEIHYKVQKVIQLNKQLQQKINKVELEKEELSNKLISSQAEIKELKKEIDLAKLAGSLPVNEEEKRKLKLKVNEYIREIDKCIGLLDN